MLRKTLNPRSKLTIFPSCKVHTILTVALEQDSKISVSVPHRSLAARVSWKRVSLADGPKILLICVSYIFCILLLRRSCSPGTRSIDIVDNKLLFFVLS